MLESFALPMPLLLALFVLALTLAGPFGIAAWPTRAFCSLAGRPARTEHNAG